MVIEDFSEDIDIYNVRLVGKFVDKKGREVHRLKLWRTPTKVTESIIWKSEKPEERLEGYLAWARQAALDCGIHADDHIQRIQLEFADWGSDYELHFSFERGE